MKLVSVTLSYPPSVNRAWRRGRGRTYLSPEARRYKEAAARQALVAGLRPAAGDIRVRLDLYPGPYLPDADNALKLVLDALNGIAWGDDSQVVGIVVEMARGFHGRREVSVSVGSGMSGGSAGEEEFRRAVEAAIRK